jgi:hypothetical protein
MICLIRYEEKIKYLIGLSVGLEFFLFFFKIQKKLQKYTKIIFFWKKKHFTLKKNHVFPSFSQSFMQNSENFPPPKKKSHCVKVGPTSWERAASIENMLGTLKMIPWI